MVVDRPDRRSGCFNGTVFTPPLGSSVSHTLMSLDDGTGWIKGWKTAKEVDMSCPIGVQPAPLS